jgi:hypothetical protein
VTAVWANVFERGVTIAIFANLVFIVLSTVKGRTAIIVARVDGLEKRFEDANEESEESDENGAKATEKAFAVL